MSEAAPYNPLPRVEKTDLHLVAIDEILDPNHTERWATFARENSEFAREVLLEAHRLGESGESVEQVANNIATFVYQAMKNAFERRANAAGVEGSQPSDEPQPGS